MDIHQISATAVALILVLVACTDWRDRRIPNKLNLLLLLLSAISFASNNGISVSQWAINLCIASVLGLPGYLSGHLGGGDVKLLLALSPLWPPMSFLWAFSAGVLTLTLIIVAIDVIQQRNTLKERGLPLGTALCLGVFSLPLAAAI